ncbi:hypothetical protein J3R74_001794 [Puniceicoccus vermicola]|nr:hypothetical protein [Puniceicoccus vermicola]
MTEVDGAGGTVHLMPNEIFREKINIRSGGTETHPLIIEGNGAVVHLGRNVSNGPWTKIGEEYRLEQEVPPHQRHYTTSPLFIDGLPVWAEHPKGLGKPAWHGGSLRYDEAGKMVVRFPKGLSPENSSIVLVGRDLDPVVHGSGGKHVIIRDLTVAFAGNDGFNFHNRCIGFKLVRVRALFNGDQGISSHGESEVVVELSEVAFNGSQSAGVVDINNARTGYRDLLNHQNRNAGFLLKGSRHRLEAVVSFGNPGGDLPEETDSVVLVDCSAGVEKLPKHFPEWGSPEDLSNRMARFEELMPVD